MAMAGHSSRTSPIPPDRMGSGFAVGHSAENLAPVQKSAEPAFLQSHVDAAAALLQRARPSHHSSLSRTAYPASSLLFPRNRNCSLHRLLLVFAARQ